MTIEKAISELEEWCRLTDPDFTTPLSLAVATLVQAARSRDSITIDGTVYVRCVPVARDEPGVADVTA